MSSSSPELGRLALGNKNIPKSFMFEDSWRMIVISENVLFCETVDLRNQWAIYQSSRIYLCISGLYLAQKVSKYFKHNIKLHRSRNLPQIKRNLNIKRLMTNWGNILQHIWHKRVNFFLLDRSPGWPSTTHHPLASAFRGLNKCVPPLLVLGLLFLICKEVLQINTA